MNKIRIKQIIWDVDGTLYQSIPALKPYLSLFYQQKLAQYLPDLSKEQRNRVFDEQKQKLLSHTLSLMAIGHEPLSVIAEELELAIPKNRFVRPDSRLSSLFQQLIKRGISNYALRNGKTAGTKAIIGYVGLLDHNYPGCEYGPFVRVYGTFDFFKVPKPTLSIFAYFVNELKFEPQYTLAIGDRPEIDLEPAKKLGMNTALVWQKSRTKQTPSYVDFVLPTVYDLAKHI